MNRGKAKQSNWQSRWAPVCFVIGSPGQEYLVQVSGGGEEAQKVPVPGRLPGEDTAGAASGAAITLY